MGNPKKCLSMWVGGKIIPNLSGKDDEGWTKIKLILSTFKSFKTFGKEFWFKKNLSAKVFQILVPKTMKGEISQPSRALELWRGEFCFKRIFCLSFYFSLSIFLYQFLSLSLEPLCHEDYACIYREMGVWKGQRGVEGATFLPPPTTSRACQPCLVPLCWKKKTKKSAKMGPRTQCWPALCFKILVPAGTRIKFLSAGLKIGVPAGTVLRN